MSDRYEGGILSGTAPTVTLQSANGVYTLSQEMQYQGQGVWPTAAQTPILKSLRFRKSANGLITRTFSTTGTSRQAVTFSLWTKRGALSSGVYLAGGYDGSSASSTDIYFNSSDQLVVNFGGSSTFSLITTQLFRDPSAWYHIVVVFDTTQATAANRVKLYVNGSQVTAFGTANYPSQNANGQFWTATSSNCIGAAQNSGGPYDGYIAEVNFIDGVALTPSSFGTTDVNGIWQPIPYAGAYGTNGFYLKFTDVALTSGSNAGLGKDFSGNTNYWDTTNISVTAGTTYDSMLDSPSNASSTIANYAVLNALQTNNSGALTYSNANLTAAHGSGTTSTGGVYKALSSIATNAGKFYAEFVLNSFYSNGAAGADMAVGVTSDLTAGNLLASPVGFSYYADGGNKFTNGAGASYGSSWTTGDVIGIALDMDNGSVWFSKNGTWQASGNPATGANPAFTGLTGSYAFAFANSTASTAYNQNFTLNFGQQPFTYTPPTGFNRLNTYNLPVPTIPAGNKVMDATLYTGNGTAVTVTNAGTFQPDLVWGKSRSNAISNYLVDSVRGVSKALSSDRTDAEDNAPGYYVTAFNSNGFTVGLGTGLNTNGATYVGWQWQAGQGVTSSNTNGTITSTTSVNPVSGFSIVTYTGNLTTTGTATVGHGLGVAPSMIIFKGRNATTSWPVFHQNLPSWNYCVFLDLTNSQTDQSSNGTLNPPTSTVFSTNWTTGMNTNGTTEVAYCFAPVAGFSAFGSYVGNGSDDGPFIYCGFRPKFIYRKCISNAGENSMQYDTSMNPYNAAQEWLSPNLSAASNTAGGYFIDFVSNGVKIRHSATGNNSGRTYIYMAFAENPFKMARAR